MVQWYNVTMIQSAYTYRLTVIISEGRQSTPTTVTRTELERARVVPSCLERIFSFNIVFCDFILKLIMLSIKSVL